MHQPQLLFPLCLSLLVSHSPRRGQASLPTSRVLLANEKPGDLIRLNPSLNTEEGVVTRKKIKGLLLKEEEWILGCQNPVAHVFYKGWAVGCRPASLGP